MRYRCENGHIVKRREGQTSTKCGFCQDNVLITPLPPEDQHSWIEKDTRARSTGSVAAQNKSKRRARTTGLQQGLSSRLRITGHGESR